MPPVFCLVDQRDKIAPDWELVAGIIASDLQEAKELIASYQAENFNISEYQLRPCDQRTFQLQRPNVILMAPSLKGNYA